MITFAKGNFFDYPADIRVNTVNCVGAMGAGIAAQFRGKYPKMDQQYSHLCRQKLIRPGKPYAWSNDDLFNMNKRPLIIINFPTKDHWRNPSQYTYIEEGLKWLRIFLLDKPDSTITIPALGCGLGGLDWNRVKPMIQLHLSGLSTHILVFEPQSDNSILP